MVSLTHRVFFAFFACFYAAVSLGSQRVAQHVPQQASAEQPLNRHEQILQATARANQRLFLQANPDLNTQERINVITSYANLEARERQELQAFKDYWRQCYARFENNSLTSLEELSHEAKLEKLFLDEQEEKLSARKDTMSRQQFEQASKKLDQQKKEQFALIEKALDTTRFLLFLEDMQRHNQINHQFPSLGFRLQRQPSSHRKKTTSTTRGVYN